MKNYISTLFFVMVFSFPTKGQSTSTDEIRYIKEFGWTISIPKFFERVPDSEISRMNVKNKEKVQAQNPNIDFEGEKTTLFLHKENYSSIEAYYGVLDNPYSNPNELTVALNDATFRTLTAGLPGNTTYKINDYYEKIGTHNFYVFQFRLSLENKASFSGYFFKAVVDGKLLSIDVYFSDPIQGALLLSSLKSSKFTQPIR